MERIAFLVSLLLVVVTPALAQDKPAAQPPVASPAEEAYNLGLVVQKMEAHVAAGDLPSLLKYNYVSMRAFQSLLYRPALALPEKQAQVRPTLMHFSTKLTAVGSAAMNGRLNEAVSAMKELTTAWAQVKALYPPEFLGAMSRLASRIYCPKHPDVTGAEGERCAKCGRSLQRMDEFCGLPSSDPMVRPSLLSAPKLVPGEKADVVLKLLRKDGLPVRPTDLLTTHTERIHLFAIDSTLSDYHHAHPTPGTNAGDYLFSFTPQSSRGYRLWLDLLPAATRMEEMPSLDLGSFRPASFNSELADTFTNSSWRLKLSVDNAPLRARVPSWGRLNVTDLAGVPCTRLEPIMANFAHFVGFHEDRKTVYHLHAAGLQEIVDPTLRSGPEVQLYLPVLKAGFIRLFAQVQIDGQVITAPFGISVQP